MGKLKSERTVVADDVAKLHPKGIQLGRTLSSRLVLGLGLNTASLYVKDAALLVIMRAEQSTITRNGYGWGEGCAYFSQLGATEGGTGLAPVFNKACMTCGAVPHTSPI